MTYDPDKYWLDRGGASYMASIAVPEYEKHLHEQIVFIQDNVLSLNPRRLLDFGCGTGKFFDLWVRNVPCPEGYDISPTMLNAAQDRIKIVAGPHTRNWEFPLQAGGKNRTKLPYQNGKFDVIVACEVLAHVLPDEIEATIKELWRILRPEFEAESGPPTPGGTLAIITAAPFENGAEHNFDYDYISLLARDFKITYDRLCEPYRHILAVRNG